MFITLIVLLALFWLGFHVVVGIGIAHIANNDYNH